MIELSHFYSLTPEWQYQPAKQMNVSVINDKITLIPKNLGSGLYYFTQINSNCSVLLLDATFTSEIIVNRLESDHDLYILHFDISPEINEITVNKNHTNEIPFESGFSVLHTSISNSFKPIKGQRIFALRLLVNAKTLENYIHKSEKTIKNIKKNILFYDHINSNSKILINTIKEKPVFDLEFDSYLKGVSLKILGNFISSYTNPTKNEISKKEMQAINKTKEYLLNNLYSHFPSITFLARIAAMSTTKYKVLFKKHYTISPNQFFMREKLKLAKKMLTSGKFSSQIEIIKILNCSNAKYFNNKYNEQFGNRPIHDLIRNK